MKLYLFTGEDKYNRADYTYQQDITPAGVVVIKYVRESICEGLRRNISSTLKLVDQEAFLVLDYSQIYAVEHDGYFYYLKIVRHNRTKRQTEIEFTSFDEYSKVVENYEYEANIYPHQTQSVTMTVDSYLGEIRSECTTLRAVEWQALHPADEVGEPDDLWDYYEFCESISTGCPSGKVHIWRKEILPFNPGSWYTQRPGRFVYGGCETNTYSLALKDACPLLKVFQLYCEYYNLTFSSALLFNGTNPITGDANDLNYCVGIKSNYIGQKTDPATNGMVKFKDFIEDMKIMFNANWFIQNGVFIFEHVNYFVNGGSYTEQVDIPDLQSIPGYNDSYEIEYTETQKREQFQFVDKTTAYFNAGEIEYNAPVTTGETKTFGCSVFSNDIAYIYSEVTTVSKDGLILFALDGYGVIATKPVYVNGVTIVEVINGYCGWPYLIETYGFYQKQFPGKYYGLAIEFYSYVKRRRIEMRLSLCEFDSFVWRTFYGIANVTDVEINMRTGIVILTLIV